LRQAHGAARAVGVLVAKVHRHQVRAAPRRHRLRGAKRTHAAITAASAPLRRDGAVLLAAGVASTRAAAVPARSGAAPRRASRAAAGLLRSSASPAPRGSGASSLCAAAAGSAGVARGASGPTMSRSGCSGVAGASARARSSAAAGPVCQRMAVVRCRATARTARRVGRARAEYEKQAAGSAHASVHSRRLSNDRARISGTNWHTHAKSSRLKATVLQPRPNPTGAIAGAAFVQRRCRSRCSSQPRRR
jgi:hypothetical protein